MLSLISERGITRVTYTLLACAQLWFTAAARADSVPTVIITSASGYAYFAGGPDGCAGVCFSLSNPTFSVGFEGFVPSPNYQAVPGYPFSDYSEFNPAAGYGETSNPSGVLVVDGVSYPAIYYQLQVTGDQSFIVPYAGTIEIPATLSGNGVACTGGTPYYGCGPSPSNPNPVVIADIDLDIPGYLVFDFSPFAGVAFYNARFTPIPEPATMLVVLPALALFSSKKNRLKGVASPPLVYDTSPGNRPNPFAAQNPICRIRELGSPPASV